MQEGGNGKEDWRRQPEHAGFPPDTSSNYDLGCWTSLWWMAFFSQPVTLCSISLFPIQPRGPIKGNVSVALQYLSLGWRFQSGCSSLVPPGQRGTKPLDFAQVDEEGAVRAVHSVEGVARIRGPANAHPLEEGDTACSQQRLTLDSDGFESSSSLRLLTLTQSYHPLFQIPPNQSEKPFNDQLQFDQSYRHFIIRVSSLLPVISAGLGEVRSPGELTFGGNRHMFARSFQTLRLPYTYSFINTSWPISCCFFYSMLKPSYSFSYVHLLVCQQEQFVAKRLHTEP